MPHGFPSEWLGLARHRAHTPHDFASNILRKPSAFRLPAGLFRKAPNALLDGIDNVFLVHGDLLLIGQVTSSTIVAFVLASIRSVRVR